MYLEIKEVLKCFTAAVEILEGVWCITVKFESLGNSIVH